MLVADDIF
jgi:hypothetical protein